MVYDKLKIKVEEISWKEPEEIYDETIDNYVETENDVDCSRIETTVYINNKEITQFTDIYAFFANILDKQMGNYHFEGCCRYDRETNKVITKQWAYNYSGFYPFTCSCGVAGCASIWDGIHSKYRKHSVEWRIGKHDGYHNILDKQFYSFERYNYEEEVLVAWEDVVNIIKKNPNNQDKWIVEQIKQNENYKNSILYIKEKEDEYI